MKIKADTIARTIVLILALVNQALAIMGKGSIDITESDIYQLVSLIFTIGSAVVSWWYNNDFTHEALLAGEYLQKLKKEKREG